LTDSNSTFKNQKNLSFESEKSIFYEKTRFLLDFLSINFNLLSKLQKITVLKAEKLH